MHVHQPGRQAESWLHQGALSISLLQLRVMCQYLQSRSHLEKISTYEINFVGNSIHLSIMPGYFQAMWTQLHCNDSVTCHCKLDGITSHTSKGIHNDRAPAWYHSIAANYACKAMQTVYLTSPTVCAQIISTSSHNAMLPGILSGQHRQD